MVLYFLNLGVYYELTLLYVYPRGGDMQSVVDKDLSEYQRTRPKEPQRSVDQVDTRTLNGVFAAYHRDGVEAAATECSSLLDGFPEKDITERAECIARRLFQMGIPCASTRAIAIMAVTMLNLGDEDEQDDQLRPGMILVA